MNAAERRLFERTRRGFLATADDDGRPAAVPVCFAIVDGRPVTPVDEKPTDADPLDLRRLRDVRANPAVCLTVDRYDEDWTNLAWAQLRGTGSVLEPPVDGHADALRALRAKYDQYEDHDLETRPLIRIDPGHVVSWGL